MYLKRIEIFGFKSFAQKSVIDFDLASQKNITAVVGPNGSGKSNIADAIRWVTGEQSTKNLRSKKSEDIIFCGTAGRSRSSYAEVSLVLSSDTLVKFEVNNKQFEMLEIEIARKIYRSGESEYLINRKRVRLTDIQQLLASLGFGQSSYTVIGQGMVDRLLFFSPSERKVLFDEAAGVKQYEIKREQSLRKLEQTDSNLIRLRDILAELEPRVADLRRLVKRAEGRKEAELEVQKLEVKLYSSLLFEYTESLEVFKNLKNETQDKLAKIDEKLESLSATSANRGANPHKIEKTKLEMELASLTDLENKTRQDIAFLRGQIESTAINKEQSLLKREVSIKEKDDLLEKIAFLESKLADEGLLISELEQKIATIREKESVLSSQINDIDNKILEVDANPKSNEVDSIKENLMQLEDEKRELSTSILRAREQRFSENSSFERAKIDVEKLSEQLRIMDSQRSESQKAVLAAKAVLNELSLEQKNLLGNLKGLESKISNKEDLIHGLSSYITSESLQTFTEKVAKTRSDRDLITGLLTSVNSVTCITKLKEVYLGLSAGLDVLFDDFEKISRALNENERAALEEGLRSLRSENNQINRDLSACQIHQAKTTAEISSIESRLEELDERIRAAKSEMSLLKAVSAPNNTDSSTAALEKRLTEIEQKISILDEEIRKENSSVSEKKNLYLVSKNEILGELQKIQSDIYSLEVELTKNKNIQANQKSEITSAKNRIGDIVDEIDSVKTEDVSGTNDFDSKLKIKQKELDHVEMDIAKKRGEIGQCAEKEKIFEQKFYTIDQEKRQIMDSRTALVQKISSMEVDAAKNSVRLEDLNEEITLSGLQVSTAEIHSSLDQMEKDVLKLKIENMKRKLASIGTVDPETEAEYADIENRSTEMKAQVVDLTTAKENLEKVVKELDQKIKVQFAATFKNIGGEFERYFKMLFNGGEASLNLGEDEEGSFGIEIKANPPGKRLQSLNVLSGGERTLTSLALLFAILSVNPSPFVVLDEVDAALDESNTTRFVGILTDLAKKTQFIIISHNRDTMKVASNLYGVTMDDEHISKLISVKLTEALVGAK